MKSKIGKGGGVLDSHKDDIAQQHPARNSNVTSYYKCGTLHHIDRFEPLACCNEQLQQMHTLVSLAGDFIY